MPQTISDPVLINTAIYDLEGDIEGALSMQCNKDRKKIEQNQQKTEKRAK